MQKQQVLESMSHHMGRSGMSLDWERAFKRVGIANESGKRQRLIVPSMYTLKVLTGRAGSMDNVTEMGGTKFLQVCLKECLQQLWGNSFLSTLDEVKVCVFMHRCSYTLT